MCFKNSHWNCWMFKKLNRFVSTYFNMRKNLTQVQIKPSQPLWLPLHKQTVQRKVLFSKPVSLTSKINCLFWKVNVHTSFLFDVFNEACQLPSLIGLGPGSEQKRQQTPWMDGRMYGWVYGRMDGKKEEWMDGWMMDGRMMDGWWTDFIYLTFECSPSHQPDRGVDCHRVVPMKNNPTKIRSPRFKLKVQ